MKHFIVAALTLAALTFLAPSGGDAQVVRRPGRRPPVARRPSPPVGTQIRKDAETLEGLVRQLADAVVRADVQTLARLQADDFRGSSEGINFNKRSFRAGIEAGLVRVGAWTIEDIDVDIRGNSAVLKGRSVLTNAVYMGKDYSGDYEWTSRFVKNGGEWRIVNSQSKRIRK